MDWFRFSETGDVAHYCKGVETNDKVIERYKEGVQGNIKPKGTNNEGTMWFNPAALVAEGEEEGSYKCLACGVVSPGDVECIQMGD